MRTYLKIYVDRLSGAESQPTQYHNFRFSLPLNNFLSLYYTPPSPPTPAILATPALSASSAAILAASISLS